MRRRILAFVAMAGAILLAPSPVQALRCTCLAARPFPANALAGEIVVRAEIVEHRVAVTSMGGGFRSSHILILRLIDVIKGGLRSELARVEFSHLDCAGNNSAAFVPGSEWLFVLRLNEPLPAPPPDLAAVFSTEACGEHWLRVVEGRAIGIETRLSLVEIVRALKAP